jgi:hypothetical protein
MKAVNFLSVLIFVPFFATAQPSQTITMNNNRISAKDVKPEFQYLFDDFQGGRVVMKDRRSINCQLNYNFLTDEMLFIDEKGKKMALANPDEVLHIYIGNRLFLPTSKGYFEVIEKEPVSLLYKWTCNVADKGKEGAMGLTTDAPSVYQMNQFSFDAKLWKLPVDKQAVVSVEVIPYLLVKTNPEIIKGEKDFLKAFPGKRSQIKSYIEENPVDFRKEKDLRRLIKFCNSI